MVRRNLRGKISESAKNYRKEVYYIHRPTLARHIGDEKSLHNWCKKQILNSNDQEFRLTRGTNAPQPLLNQQLIKRSLSANSISYYQKLFRTLLYLVHEELTFTKLQGLVEFQMRNGLKFGSADKLNDKACSEIVNVIATVIVDCLTDYFKECNFITASADASEARKTSEEKELVFGKVIIKGYNGVVPCCFLLKCQSLKEFGGVTGKATFEAVKNALTTCMSEEAMKKMLICIAIDGAAVNFGKHHGAVNIMKELVGWYLYRIHCTNHQLELSIKESFKKESAFNDLKEMLDTLYHLFRNNSKSCRIYHVLADTMRVKPLRFTRCGGTRFQAHTRAALASFFRNYLVTMMFAENVEEQGDGNERLVIKEMFPKLIGFRKKWSKLPFIATANLYFEVLNETAHLSLLMESDSIMIYQVVDFVQELSDNLTDTSRSEDYAFLPFNVEEIGIGDRLNWMLEDSMKTRVSACAGTVQAAKRLKTMSEEKRKVAEVKIKVAKEIITFHNVKTGKETVERYRKVFVPIIVEKVKSFQRYSMEPCSGYWQDVECRYKEHRNPLQDF